MKSACASSSVVIRRRPVPPRVGQRNAEDHDDQAERHPLVDAETDEADAVQVLHQQLDPDPRDDDERAVDERRVAADERQQLADHQAHRDDAEDPAGDDDPDLVRHRDRDEDRVDGKDDVGQLHLDDRGPEGAEAEPRRRRFHGPAILGAAAVAEEVRVGQIQQVKRADQLDPGELEQVHRQQRRQDAEDERAENAIAQRFLLLVARQAEDENCEHQRVVGAEQPLEQDQQGDREQVGGVEIHSGARHP